MTELLPNIFAIEVPEEASRFETSLQPDNIPCVTYWYWENLDATVISLPPGSYEILFTTKGVTKAQATDILPKIERKNEPVYYQYHGDEDALGTTDWEAALQSLLKSKGLTAANFLIIKRVEG